MTIAYNPFRDVDRLFNQLARSAAADIRSMPMDLYRDGDNFVVKIDLPGVSADSIDIDVDDRTLTVRAEREQEEMTTSGEDNRWVSRERSYGSYARQLTLGAGLNLSEISAEYADGVLTLTILIGTPALSGIGAIGAALTLGLRGGGVLLSLLVLPLYIPVLIFGAGAVEATVSGLGGDGHLSLLAAMTTAAIGFAPWASAAALKIALE